MLPAIALAAGIHGDEPAGPWALLDFVADGNARSALRLPHLAVHESDRLHRRHARERRRGRPQPHLRPRRRLARSQGDPHGQSRPRLRAFDRSARGSRRDAASTATSTAAASSGAAAVRALDEAGLPVDPMAETFDSGRSAGRFVLRARARADRRRRRRWKRPRSAAFPTTCSSRAGRHATR